MAENDESTQTNTNSNTEKNSHTNQHPQQTTVQTSKEMKQQDKQEKDEPLEEWEIQLNQSKTLGDNAFRKSDYPTAISHYTQALSLDPNHTILLSNRSGAYLANHEKSKALADARQCIKSNPTFVKGYTRCASAVVALGRFKEGLDLYKKVLKELDSENVIAKKGVEECQKKLTQQREWEMERVRRRVEEQRKKEEMEKEQKLKEEKESAQNEEDLKNGESERNQNDGNGGGGGDDDDDDDMDDFFSEIETVVEQTKKKPTPTSTETTASTPDTQQTNPPTKKPSFQLDNSNLLPSKDQISYILQPSHAWLNLNPYHVLSITSTQALHPQCTIDKIEKRYRTISLLIHPDKNLDNVTQAELAFDEVKKAMDVLRNEDRRTYTLQLIHQGMKIAKKSSKEPSSLSDTEWNEKCIKKVFAQVEQKRREVEARKKKQEEREQNQEMEELAKLKKEKEFEKNWKESTRVEKRIGNWRDFQSHKSSSSGSTYHTDKKHRRK